MMQFVTRSSQETIDLAKSFAKDLRPGDVVTLSGTLGTGKTQFVIGVCQGLQAEMRATSPTFTIINEYNAPWGRVVHVDLYRIERDSELSELGIEEYFSRQCICLIEWPERLAPRLPKDRIEITFAHGMRDTDRLISINRLIPQ